MRHRLLNIRMARLTLRWEGTCNNRVHEWVGIMEVKDQESLEQLEAASWKHCEATLKVVIGRKELPIRCCHASQVSQGEVAVLTMKPSRGWK